ncbi:MAG TPA: MFS transporter [Ktedonosporobacter sp.]|jgi:fucose permease|nr:MFS transporter [Ktedonosporobacter sp.]
MDRNATPRHLLLLSTLFLVYVSCGIIAMLPGPALPVLAAHTDVPLDITGWIFTANALGFALGVMISGILSTRINSKYLLMIGVSVIGIAAIIIPWTHIFALLLAAQFIAGIGFGAVDVGINVIATLTFHNVLGEILNTLHSAFGLGALIGPLLLSLSLKFVNESIWAFAAGTVIALIAFVLLVPQHIPAIVRQNPPSEQQSMPSRSRVLAHAALWFMALQMFLYVGAETSFSGWVATATSQSAKVSLVIAAPTAAMFWLGLTSGRLLGAQLLKHAQLNENRLLYLSFIGGGLSGLLVAVFTGQLWLDFAASLLMGLFLGPIFPGIIAIASRRFVYALNIISTVMLLSGGAAGTIFPVLIGTFITHIGIAPGMAFPAIMTLLIALPFFLAREQPLLQFNRNVPTIKAQETSSTTNDCSKEHIL